MPDPVKPALTRKIIRNVAWLVAWDEAGQSHCYRRDVDLAIEGDTIAAIGANLLTSQRGRGRSPALTR